MLYCEIENLVYNVNAYGRPLALTVVGTFTLPFPAVALPLTLAITVLHKNRLLQ